ncbi:MAG: aminotransferase class IV [Bacteroidetes bacterium]|nr:aminotransferase class IV [Bacteroidota bacterium]
MCQFFETIKIINFSPQNLEFHNARLNFTRKEIFGTKDPINLNDILSSISIPTAEIHKCRVIYSISIKKIEVLPYFRKEIKKLKIIYSDEISYDHKSTDREFFNELLEKKEDCDEILIVKNNLITDTSFSNIAFYDGAKWFTPAKPILKGTKREMLIRNLSLNEKNIRIEEILKNFTSFSLINAMLELSENIIPIENISM